MSNKVLCLGEALIDVVMRDDSSVEHVGGSLLNVAAGIATLGNDSSICAWWGPDERGARLAAWATDSGVAIVPGTDSAEKTAVAYAKLDADGRATYEFDLEWNVPEIGDLGQYTHLHTGSIAATLEPGGSRVVEIARAIKPQATISYDPNIRPALMVSPEQVRGRVEEIVELSDLVKVSDEDLDWLYPGEPVENVMRRWIAAGPSMVVVTRGPWGAYALLAGNRDLLHIDQMDVEVGDTVGAGDSFMAGLISGLLKAGLLGAGEARQRLRDAGWSDVQPALHTAVVTSGITVSKNGAYAPAAAEVEAVQAADPALR
ncbi:MAG: carbohydrate kinase [Propioniciclava sp.]|uniref:carbohydrate kinase family protein n=1 Tax=Propioniciclava sp. TaxID=2038686 RepID=UPI0039E323E4